MRKIVGLFLITIILGTFLSACHQGATQMRKNVTGRAGETMVVMPKDIWKGKAGDTIRAILGQPQVGLPQGEPLLDLIDVPYEAFKDIIKTSRNIIQTRISKNVEKTGITFTDDVWAYPQATIQINAKTQEQFIDLFVENKDKILSYFIAAEKERNMMNYKRVYEKEVYNVLDKDFGFTLKVPSGFRIMKQEKNLIWIQFDTPEIFQGIVVYTFPYVSDSAFTVNYQLPIRDSLLKANVPGPTKGSYMTTEKQFDQIVNTTTHNGNYAMEMRGLWAVENDFMGGPYVALSELDLANKRVINVFGFVYRPNKRKRNLLRQVESMLYSLKLNNQADNDKLNKQTGTEVKVKG